MLKMSNLDVGEAKGKGFRQVFFRNFGNTPQLSGGEDHGDFSWYLPYLPSPQVVGTPRQRKKRLHC